MNLDEDLLSETENTELTDGEIFTKIWTSPRMVFRYLNDTRYDKFVTILLILAGISRAFDRASLKNMGDNLPLIAVLSICIILGGLFGWISYYIYAALLSWAGTWLNGKGNTNSLLRMISHAMIPMIASMILLIPQISVFGNEIFQSDSNVYGTGMASTIMYYFPTYVGISLSIWTIVLVVIGISEVQKISVLKSILNMILPVLVYPNSNDRICSRRLIWEISTNRQLQLPARRVLVARWQEINKLKGSFSWKIYRETPGLRGAS